MRLRAFSGLRARAHGHTHNPRLWRRRGCSTPRASSLLRYRRSLNHTTHATRSIVFSPGLLATDQTRARFLGGSDSCRHAGGGKPAHERWRLRRSAITGPSSSMRRRRRSFSCAASTSAAASPCLIRSADASSADCTKSGSGRSPCGWDESLNLYSSNWQPSSRLVGIPQQLPGLFKRSGVRFVARWMRA